jgi:hypothetical protein
MITRNNGFYEAGKYRQMILGKFFKSATIPKRNSKTVRSVLKNKINYRLLTHLTRK